MSGSNSLKFKSVMTMKRFRLKYFLNFAKQQSYCQYAANVMFNLNAINKSYTKTYTRHKFWQELQITKKKRRRKRGCNKIKAWKFLKYELLVSNSTEIRSMHMTRRYLNQVCIIWHFLRIDLVRQNLTFSSFE